MKITKLALSLLVGLGTGCTSVPPTPLVSDLPNCFDTNYDRERGLFTIKSAVANVVNQQCLLTVGPPGDVVSEVLGGIWDAITGLFTVGRSGETASASLLTAGRYRVYLANGGGGGAGGTWQNAFAGPGGGGGGGGAGAMEQQATVNLTEGVYKLTIGAGGPGGRASMPPPVGLGGGPGWAGSPSNIVRVATGEVVMGTPGADTYARLTRAQSERSAGKMDAHGGSGPGQASGGRGGVDETRYGVEVKAEPGASMPGRSGGELGPEDVHSSGGGGGGGATSIGAGGGGGGESPLHKDKSPERGTLGSGGGGGEGSSFESEPGARGGHGFIAFRPI